MLTHSLSVTKGRLHSRSQLLQSLGAAPGDTRCRLKPARTGRVEFVICGCGLLFEESTRLFVSRIKILIDVDRRGRGGAGLLPRIAGTGLVGAGTQENTHCDDTSVIKGSSEVDPEIIIN